MENNENKENFLSKKEKRQFIASPTSGGESRKFEAEYEEIRSGVWEIVAGTLKDLGPVEN